MNRIKRISIHRTIFLNLIFAIAFIMPVYWRLLPVLIFMMALNWIIEGSYIRNFPAIFRDTRRFLLFSFSFLYLLYVIGLIYTSNFRYAVDDLTIKLSLLIFPLIFATSDDASLRQETCRSALKWFAAGCIAGSTIMLIRAAYQAIFLHQPDVFYYSKLAWYFHPGYYSAYLIFAFSNILYGLIIVRGVPGKWRITGHIAMLLFFTLMIILLSSKTGLLIWCMVVALYVGILILSQRRFKAGAFLTAASGISFILLLMAFPNAIDRLSKAKQEFEGSDTVVALGHSTGDRLDVWKASREVIRENLLFGVGTGDVKDALRAKYSEHHQKNLLKLNLNAHNQFLQTCVTLGLTGFAILVLMFLWPALFAIRKGAWVYLSFLLIFFVSMLFESMLETQAGIVFYAFFNALLFVLAVAGKSGSRSATSSQTG